MSETPPMDVYEFLRWLNDDDPEIMKYIPRWSKQKSLWKCKL